VQSDWLEDEHMTQFKPTRSEPGTSAETVGKETLFLLGVSKLGVCKPTAVRGHLCHHVGTACPRVKPTGNQSQDAEREIFLKISFGPLD
jgi:hypothetical protein